MLCPIGQSNEKPPLQALAKWGEHVTICLNHFSYFGVTTVIPSEWNNVKQVTKKDFPCSFKIIAEIDNWVQVCFETEECFTICGI